MNNIQPDADNNENPTKNVRIPSAYAKDKNGAETDVWGPTACLNENYAFDSTG